MALYTEAERTTRAIQDEAYHLEKGQSQRIRRALDESTAGVTLSGYSLVGTPTDSDDWLIQRVTVTGTNTDIEYVIGAWDDRASLSYE